MKLTKCPNGHFYDADKHPECPYCNGGLEAGSAIAQPGTAAEAGLTAAPKGPVAGWLVVLDGPARGQDLRLGEGRNFLGVDAAGNPAALDANSPLAVRRGIVVYDRKILEVITMSENKLHFETLQLHVGQEEADPATGARAVPIYQTTSYVFNNSAHAAARFGLTDAGNIYGRLTNPTEDVLEKRIAALEGGVAGLAVASGAAAISYTIQALAQNGGHVVAQKTIYGGSYNLLEHTLPNFGITATFVDAHNLKEIEDAIQENTRLVYLETLGNPNSDIPDLDAIAEIAHKHGLPVVVDNTFGTPYLLCTRAGYSARRGARRRWPCPRHSSDGAGRPAPGCARRAAGYPLHLCPHHNQKGNCRPGPPAGPCLAAGRCRGAGHYCPCRG